jgi:hypothetical protein
MPRLSDAANASLKPAKPNLQITDNLRVRRIDPAGQNFNTRWGFYIRRQVGAFAVGQCVNANQVIGIDGFKHCSQPVGPVVMDFQ